MAIFKNSRYKGSYLYSDINNRDIVHLDIMQEVKFTPQKDDLQIEYRYNDRLDIIAERLYGDPALEWIIMQANPQYMLPTEIKEGDIINVPLPERVSEYVGEL